jgi:hypothetical protein
MKQNSACPPHLKRIKKKRNRLKPKFWFRLHLLREEKKFDRWLYDELYVPYRKAWGDEIKSYETHLLGDSK